MSQSWRLTPVLVLLYLCQRHIALAQPRIVGGVTTTIQAAPYLVNLRINGVFFCGGSLVTRQHVVTAAHCVKGKNVGAIVVTAGTSQLDGSGITRSVAKAFLPNKYRRDNENMDVAVLKLKSPINQRNVRPIDLCNTRLKVGNRLTVFGWGVTNENSKTSSNQVRRVSVPIINKNRCSRQYRFRARLTRTMFCASVPGSKDSCAGDSGGPAVFGGRLCGIVSFGVGCARRNYAGVYTSVRTTRNFIQKSMRK